MDSHGKVWGNIPYDFRRPTWSRFKNSMWNSEDERLFTDRAFGIGWDINMYQLRERFPVVFYCLLVLILLSLTRKIAGR